MDQQDKWIGVDLDGTLAKHPGDFDGSIGEPVERMVVRVNQWCRAGQRVKIMTARVSPANFMKDGAITNDTRQEITKARVAIWSWLKEHLDPAAHDLEITCQKDLWMEELWDDRAVQIVRDTGRRVDGVS